MTNKMIKKNKAVFLDRDGVIVKDPYGYVHKIKDFELYDGAISALKRLKDFKLFIVTNQSGIARGLYSHQDFHIFNNYLINILKKNEIYIEKTYYCPHHPEDNCNCRKPSPFNILKAAKEYNLDLKNSFVIGDHPSDAEMACRAGCYSIYMKTGHGKKHFDDLKKKNIKPDFFANNISQGIEIILSQYNLNKKLKSFQEIEKISKNLKKNNKIIVTTNGSFDILHKGHYYFLKQAKKQGDVLIVGLNSDSSVRKNKGPKRPINPQLTRARNLAKLPYVDYVVIFNETTPITLLERIKTHIHANGEEYGYDCVEAPTVKKYGGEIYLIKRLGDYSTTNIIRKHKTINT